MKAFSGLVCQMHGISEEERLNRTTPAVTRDYLYTSGRRLLERGYLQLYLGAKRFSFIKILAIPCNALDLTFKVQWF